MGEKNLVEKVPGLVRIRNVLMSCTNKDHLDILVRALFENCPGVNIISTGGTFVRIQQIIDEQSLTGGSLIPISDITGQPEMQGGLVKTIDWKIYLALLAEGFNPAHLADLKNLGVQRIDMTVFNLYDFKNAISKTGATIEHGRGDTDIGGPTAIRASGKNFHCVTGLTDPADYGRCVELLVKHGGCIPLDFRFMLYQKAFALTASYDTNIAAYLARQTFEDVLKTYEVAKGVYNG